MLDPKEVKGLMAVVLPQGALFRNGAEGLIRQKLLEMDLVWAVIGLAPNLFYGAGLAACVLVLRKRCMPIFAILTGRSKGSDETASHPPDLCLLKLHFIPEFAHLKRPKVRNNLQHFAIRGVFEGV